LTGDLKGLGDGLGQKMKPGTNIKTISKLSVLGGFMVAGGAHGAELLPSPPPPLANNPPFLRLGGFELTPRAISQTMFDDNITIRSIDRRSDIIFSVAPGFSIGTPQEDAGLLPGLLLDYQPQYNAYMKYDEFNSLEHRLNFDTTFPTPKLKLEAHHAFTDTTSASVDVGNLVNLVLHQTTLQSEYELTPKTSVELNLAQDIVDSSRTAQVINSTTRSIEQWFNHYLTQKFSYSAGLIAGLREVEQSSDQTFERLMLRGRYFLSDKLVARATAGIEFRQTKGGFDSVLPRFQTITTWMPADRTTVSMEAFHIERNSLVLREQNYISTGISLEVSQRITDKLRTSLKGTYSHIKYVPLTSAVTGARTDLYGTIALRADYALTEQWRLGAFYEFRDDNSTNPNFTFDNNRLGLTASWQF
jgi:hypothetical protein